MLTVIETSLFQKQWPLYWTEQQRGDFAAYLSIHPNAGSVVPNTGGLRKIRWGLTNKGKSGGVRVIYYTRTAQGELILLTLYCKSQIDNLSGAQLKEIFHALEN